MRILIKLILVLLLAPMIAGAQLNAGSLNQSAFQVPSGIATTIAMTGTAASGCSGTGTYSWVMGTSQATATQIGGNTQNLTYTGTWSSGNVEIWRMYTCSAGGSIYTNPITIVPQTPFTPGTASASPTSISSGGSATLSATLSTGSIYGPTYNYQWQNSTDNVNWTNVGSSTTTDPSYPTGALTVTATTTYYYRQAITAGPLTMYTNTVALAINAVSGVPQADNLIGSPNSNMNWTIATGYDQSGNTLSQSKSFFDNSGRLIQSQSKVFYRSSPATVLTHVLASETLMDAEGRDVLTTLPAPIDYADFNYISGFALATDGSNYTYKNFDRYNPTGSSETDLTNAPQVVGGQSTKGTLGWYYGPNNAWEPYTPTTNFPYSRNSIYRDGTNNGKKRAGTGEAYVMGSNHETSSYATQVNGELTNYLLVRNKFFTAAQMGALPTSMLNNAIQTVQKDANGNETVTIADLGGKPLITARPGTDMTFTNTFSVMAPPIANYTQQIVCNSGSGYSIQLLEGGNNMNIYMVNGGTVTSVYSGPASSYPVFSSIPGTGTLVLQSDAYFFITYVCNSIQYSTGSSAIAGATIPTVGYFKILANNTPVTITGSYTLYDMNTEAVTSLTAGQLNRGYYKVIANSGAVNVTYSNGFTDVSYNFYNRLGQLVASVLPNGVKMLEGTGYSTLSSIPFEETYTYDCQGRLVASSSPDKGASQFVYRMDGKIRFFQNALQSATGSYSYVNYDAIGRPVEAGQYQPDASGIVFNSTAMTGILENTSSTGGLTTGTKTDVTMTSFDVPDNSHGQSGYVQDPAYLGGSVSTSKRYSSIVNNTPVAANLVSQCWYNYDEEGKVLWKISYIASLGSSVGYKTLDYTYDALDHLIKKVFQKNVSAETFVHYYQYDPANGNLWYIYTNTVDNPATETLQAKYIYYLHGGLRRIELATNLQGIDYTYTLQGAPKAINNSNAAADPGSDATATDGFNPDVFGEVLDYFPNDYNNTRTTGIQPIKGVNTTSIVPTESYGGNIKAMSWYSLKPSGLGGSNSPTTYVYNYDPKYQFIASTWGTGLNFATSPATFTTTNQNQETIIVPGSGTPGTPAYDADGNILNLQRSNTGGTVTDNFTYSYSPNTNRLSGITNTGSSGGTFSFSYDVLGRETSENIGGTTKYIKYDVTGKVTLVANDAAFTQPLAAFVYDELGQKIEKISYNSSYQINQVTYYYDDVIYTQTVTGGVYGTLTPQEYQLEGAGSRIGVYFKQSNTYVYQLTDHLGNIRAVLAKTGAVQTATDYYPFGMVIATLGSTYRYGYQGQYAEADPETGWNNFELRMYNSRIGRWFSPDPAGQNWSPYEGMGNDPVSGIDPTGGVYTGPGDGINGLEVDTRDCPECTLQQVVVTPTPDQLWAKYLAKNPPRVDHLNNAMFQPTFWQRQEKGAWYQRMLYGAVNSFYVTGQNLGGKQVMGRTYAVNLNGSVTSPSENMNAAINVGTSFVPAAPEIEGAAQTTNVLYHYTSREAATNIAENGLNVGKTSGVSFMTNDGTLSGLQAQIELALPANRPLVDAVLQIDVTGLNPVLVRRVTGNLPGLEAGGGTEYIFDQFIPASRISIFR